MILRFRHRFILPFVGFSLTLLSSTGKKQLWEVLEGLSHLPAEGLTLGRLRTRLLLVTSHHFEGFKAKKLIIRVRVHPIVSYFHFLTILGESGKIWVILNRLRRLVSFVNRLDREGGCRSSNSSFWGCSRCTTWWLLTEWIHACRFLLVWWVDLPDSREG